MSSIDWDESAPQRLRLITTYVPVAADDMPLLDPALFADLNAAEQEADERLDRFLTMRLEPSGDDLDAIEARQTDEWMDRLRADFQDDQKVALLLTRLDQLPDPPLWFRIRFFVADTWFRIHNRKTGS